MDWIKRKLSKKKKVTGKFGPFEQSHAYYDSGPKPLYTLHPIKQNSYRRPPPVPNREQYMTERSRKMDFPVNYRYGRKRSKKSKKSKKSNRSRSKLF